MLTRILLVLCFVISVSQEAFGIIEYEVKRGIYPFMAFVYYPDETVVDASGLRFFRSAVLIRPEWLITSAVGLSIDDGGSNGFPRKTLLARVGATTVDSNFTLNEDEDEQEHEIIQIVRPYTHNVTEWWRTDISMLKTLLPFNMTTTVNVAALSFKQPITEKTCKILVYSTKEGNQTEDKILMQLHVELIPATDKACGSYFDENTMTCSLDSDENKDAIYDPHYCQGNSGGPLICDTAVAGLQTYVENDCKQPHLYQLVSAWEKLITCSMEAKCEDEQCANTCSMINKDTTEFVSSVRRHESTDSTTDSSTDLVTISTTLNTEVTVTSTTLADLSAEESEPTASSISTPTGVSTSTTESLITESDTDVASKEPIVELSPESLPEEDTSSTKTWPNEKHKDDGKDLEQDEDVIERKMNVEAQQKKVNLKKKNSATKRNICIFQTLFFGFIVLV